jgi:hypothetical protein
MYHLSYVGHNTQFSECANIISTYVKICGLQVMNVISIHHFPFAPTIAHSIAHTQKPIVAFHHAVKFPTD